MEQWHILTRKPKCCRLRGRNIFHKFLQTYTTRRRTMILWHFTTNGATDIFTSVASQSPTLLLYTQTGTYPYVKISMLFSAISRTNLLTLFLIRQKVYLHNAVTRKSATDAGLISIGNMTSFCSVIWKRSCLRRL